MKKISILLYFLLSILAYSEAQVIPKGMNYQAVARDIHGVVITREPIQLKVVLFSGIQDQRAIYYSELHKVTTDDSGLFNLIVGEGSDDLGDYGLIPWNKENIWMEVSVQDKTKSNYITLSSSKLLAVPYALHAGTADRLISKDKTNSSSSIAPPEPGVISTEWSVLGNAKTDASGNIFRSNSLGTSDFVDLIMITDNIERLRIRAGGDIITKLNFEIGKSLNVGQHLYVVQSATFCDTLLVKKNVVLNTVSGSTINYGPFTVANLSPTKLTGTLTVDKTVDFNTTLNVDGSTNLNGRLYVNKKSPTRFTGTLQVDSITNLNDALYVNNMSPTKLTGTLLVDGDATFNHKLKILSQYSTDTTTGSLPSGSLQVGGGAYIKENLYIGGVAKFGGPVAFAGAVTIMDGTQSTSPTTGALRVAGGVGIGLNLNVGGGAMIGGMTTIKDLSQSFNDSTGAVKVLGGVGIGKKLYVGGATGILGSLRVNGVSNLFNTLNVTNSGPYIAHFTNTTNQHGISIQVNNGAPGTSNNYLEFRNSSGGIVGRVEGENALQYKNNPNYIRELEVYQTNIEFAGVVVAQSAISLAAAIAGVVAAATSVSLCAGFGICFTMPRISLIVAAGIVVGIKSAAVIATSVLLGLAIKSKDDFETYRAARVGVTYESGSGDYAEWLPRQNKDELFLPGHIVGIKNGKISKNTDGASSLMVISTQPSVLGNMPRKGDELNYEKVAFMGQVPVHIIGKVNVGDYILPDGRHDGLGKAVSPAHMNVEDYAKIVGVAWSDSENDQYNMINVAIGLNTGDIAKVVVQQKKEIQALEVEFNESNNALAALVPGFKETFIPTELNKTDKSSLTPMQKEVSVQDVKILDTYKDKMKYLEISSEQVVEILNSTERTILENGGDISANTFWNRIKSEPGYKDQFIKDVQQIYRNEIQNQLSKIKSRK